MLFRSGAGGLKSLELRGAGEGGRLPGRSWGAGYVPCQAPVPTDAQSVGTEATHVSGNSTKVVLALVCGFGIHDFVRHVWGIPDVHPDVLVLKM